MGAELVEAWGEKGDGAQGGQERERVELAD